MILMISSGVFLWFAIRHHGDRVTADALRESNIRLQMELCGKSEELKLAQKESDAALRAAANTIGAASLHEVLDGVVVSEEEDEIMDAAIAEPLIRPGHMLDTGAASGPQIPGHQPFINYSDDNGDLVGLPTNRRRGRVVMPGIASVVADVDGVVHITGAPPPLADAFVPVNSLVAQPVIAAAPTTTPPAGYDAEAMFLRTKRERAHPAGPGITSTVGEAFSLYGWGVLYLTGSRARAHMHANCCTTVSCSN